MEWWIAADKVGKVFLFYEEPEYDEEDGWAVDSSVGNPESMRIHDLAQFPIIKSIGMREKRQVRIIMHGN